MSENKFPTIADMRDALTRLVDLGLGDHPVQILVVPETTIDVVARAHGEPPSGKPALMIEFEAVAGRLPPSIICSDRLTGNSTTAKLQ